MVMMMMMMMMMMVVIMIVTMVMTSAKGKDSVNLTMHDMYISTNHCRGTIPSGQNQWVHHSVASVVIVRAGVAAVTDQISTLAVAVAKQNGVICDAGYLIETSTAAAPVGCLGI